MKAAVRSTYGLGDVLRIKELENPVPKENEVLIKVYASSVNRSDLHVLTGKPFFMRLFTGLFKPKFSITGTDFAGQIETVGASVQSFKPGDKVMGYGGVFGCRSHAQYLTLPETKGIIIMPVNINYEQAAACTEGAYYAASGIIRLKPKTGQKALVIGATGSIGSSNGRRTTCTIKPCATRRSWLRIISCYRRTAPGPSRCRRRWVRQPTPLFSTRAR